MFVIAEIKTGHIVNDEYYRNEQEAYKNLEQYDMSVYTVMTEDRANDKNENYLFDFYMNDEIGEPKINPDLEFRASEIKDTVVSESRKNERAMEEGWCKR